MATDNAGASAGDINGTNQAIESNASSAVENASGDRKARTAKAQRVGLPFYSIYQEGPADDPSQSEVQETPMDAVPPLYPDWESQDKDHLSLPPHTKREQWTNQVEFMMVLLSVAVGLGNVWKFPLEAYNNGGGAFLIPYLIVVTVIARPMYFIELAVGQFCSRGPVGMWDAVPIMRGLGWSIFCISALLSVFYLALLAWCGLFFIHSFRNPLPWADCDIEHYRGQNFDDPLFRENAKYFKCDGPVGKYYGNASNSSQVTAEIPTPVLFFVYRILKAKHDISDGIGAPQWEMTTALFILWCIVFAVMLFGTKSTGKVAYFTAIFPYFVLFILLGRAVSLPGAVDGIMLYLKPDFKKLFTIKVWYRATAQAFFSLGIGFGTAVVTGSYNPLYQKTYNDALLIGMVDTFTSFLSGLTVFSILGVLAHSVDAPIDKVVPNSGAGLSFIGYPLLMTKFGGQDYRVPQIFSVLFFSMLLTLGVGSAVSFLHVLTATVLDRLPFLSNKRWYKIVLVACISFASFLVGLIFCTPVRPVFIIGSGHMINLFDYYGSSFLFFIVMIEISALAYFYGMKNLERDLRFIYPDYTCLTLKCDINCKLLRYWGYVMPVVFLGVFIYVCLTLNPLDDTVDEDALGNKYYAPLYAQTMGWVMFATMAGLIPAYGICVFFSRKTTSYYKKWMASVCPNKYWGPKVPEDKVRWVQFKQGYDGNTYLWSKMFGKVKQADSGGQGTEPTAEELDGEADEVSATNSADTDQLESTENIEQ